MKIAIIGRPNVGKSTLFNRLIGKRKALETSIPGTTRDQNRAITHWAGQELELIDTPGIKSPNPQETTALRELETSILKQSERASAEADVIIYLIDFQTGPMSEDYELIKKLRRQKKKPIILAVNKADKINEQAEAQKYVKLGLGEASPLSAKSGLGANRLLDRVISFAPAKKEKTVVETPRLPKIKIALVGKPNVGKSSLFNALLQEEQVVVSPLPHTTRDTNDTTIFYREHELILIDTAGLRKKARIYESDQIEIFSVQATLQTIKKADIILLLTEAAIVPTVQDLKISKLITDNLRGLIIVANKWDTVAEKTTTTMAHYRTEFYNQFRSLDWAPLIFTDVRVPRQGRIWGLDQKYLGEVAATARGKRSTGANPLHQLLDLALAIHQNQSRWLTTEQLKNFIHWAAKKHAPPICNNRRPRIISFEQVGTIPPTFQLTLPSRITLPEHYLNYLKNSLQTQFSFWGTPIHLLCRSPKRKN
ncbi:MAG TPA: ribosome biogenesis GTPase Der [Candidatus Jacksonbacteria bacterium]|nr:ribosome biogenesis GTPase Der [Candidatus Jacksonbacteria bacterium]